MLGRGAFAIHEKEKDMGTPRGTQRLGHIIVDRISFTKTGDGIALPTDTEIPGAVKEAELADKVETYLLQLPGSGPGTMLTMSDTGDLEWIAIPTTPQP